jgi:hypothetical protein
VFTSMNFDELSTVEDLDEDEGIKSSSFYSGILCCACVMCPCFGLLALPRGRIRLTVLASVVEVSVGESCSR